MQNCQMSKKTKYHGDVRTTDRTPTSDTFKVPNTWFAKSLMAAWHQRQARFEQHYQSTRHTSQSSVALAAVALTVAAPASAPASSSGESLPESVGSAYRSQLWAHRLCAPMLWLTAFRNTCTLIMLCFATHTHDVPAFSSPAFSSHAIWFHVFQSRVFSRSSLLSGWKGEGNCSILPGKNCCQKTGGRFEQLLSNGFIFHAARRRSGLRGTGHRGLAEVKLQRFHHQFTRSQSTGLSRLDVWRAMLESCHKLKPKPKIFPKLKDALIWSALLQKSIDNAAVKDCRKRLQTCVSTSGGHFEHKIWWSDKSYWQLCLVCEIIWLWSFRFRKKSLRISW